MTSEKLKQIAVRLSNSCYVRYWLHFNCPQEDPVVMAIGIVGSSDVRQLDKELCGLGFTRQSQEDVNIWTIARTDEVKILQDILDSDRYSHKIS